MNKITCVIIDDEYFNRSLIKMLLLKMDPDFIVLGEAENINEGYKLICNTRPEVVFLDIKMPDGSGFMLLDLFEKINFQVLFVTGFDEFAMKAFEFNEIDYVLKPIDLDKFKLSLENIKLKKENLNTDSNRISDDPLELNIKGICIQSNVGVTYLSSSEIVYIEVFETHSVFYTLSSKEINSFNHFSEYKFFLKQLPQFIRLDSGSYINSDHIESLPGEKQPFKLKNGLQLNFPEKTLEKLKNLTLKGKGLNS